MAVQEQDQLVYNFEPYLTCSRAAAPLATTDFVAIDQGSFLLNLIAPSRLIWILNRKL